MLSAAVAPYTIKHYFAAPFYGVSFRSKYYFIKATRRAPTHKSRKNNNSNNRIIHRRATSDTKMFNIVWLMAVSCNSGEKQQALNCFLTIQGSVKVKKSWRAIFLEMSEVFFIWKFCIIPFDKFLKIEIFYDKFKCEVPFLHWQWLLSAHLIFSIR